MAEQFSSLSPKHREFIARQKVFFVATASTAGRVNVSPKGLGTFRAFGPNSVAYLDITGSGSETRAHLAASDDKRLTILFCAFEGDPLILRLYGQGRSLMRGTPEYEAMIGDFEELPGARQIVLLDVDLVQTSCGWGVPIFEYKQDRSRLMSFWVRQGAKRLEHFWRVQNIRSIDGVATGFEPELMASRDEVEPPERIAAAISSRPVSLVKKLLRIAEH